VVILCNILHNKGGVCKEYYCAIKPRNETISCKGQGQRRQSPARGRELREGGRVWCVSVTFACLTGTHSMYAPLASFVGGSWLVPSPRPRPDQPLKIVYLNTRFTLGCVAYHHIVYSVAYSVACSIPRCYIGYILQNIQGCWPTRTRRASPPLPGVHFGISRCIIPPVSCLYFTVSSAWHRVYPCIDLNLAVFQQIHCCTLHTAHTPSHCIPLTASRCIRTYLAVATVTVSAEACSISPPQKQVPFPLPRG